MIEIYADTADLIGIRDAKANPVVNGFTTNPTLMAKAGVKNYEEFAKDALQIVEGLPISFEVFSDDFDDMERQARKIASWGSNVNVKIPVTNTKGESAAPLVRRLSDSGILCNVTAIFTEEQVIEILKHINRNDAVILSIFAGRIADTSIDPIRVINHMMPQYSGKAKFLWASAREVLNVYHADTCNCDIITLSPELLKKYTELMNKDHDEYSLETVKMFYNDAQKSGFVL